MWYSFHAFGLFINISHSQTVPAPTVPEQPLPYQMLHLQTLPPGLICGGVYESLRLNTAAACEKNPLEKKDPRPKTLKAKMSPPETIPPVKGIIRLKCFQSKCPTTGPRKKVCHQYKEGKAEVRQLVYIFLYFCFLYIYQCTSCLSIDIHFVNIVIDKYLFSIY